MASQVFFADMRTSPKEGLIAKFARLLETAGLADRVGANDLTAIKIHFGEWGNHAYIRPIFVRPVSEAIEKAGGKPFLTDANTLYVGTRSDSAGHLVTALRHGFDYTVTGAPLIIADGLRGGSQREVHVEDGVVERAWIGAEIADADAIVSLAHFKGHELSGFGGTIKNLGMGCASRRGKLDQHSNLSPAVSDKKCVACGSCVDHCAQSAISLNDRAHIDPDKCVGCGECILVCPEQAINIQWDMQIPDFQRRMVDYTRAVLTGKEHTSFFVNFLTNVSPACDCYPHADAALIADVGILASIDPIAIDQASVDLVNQQEGNPLSLMGETCGAGCDKFREVYPRIDWTIQLDYGQKKGLGHREYELVAI
jgi:uncharacterized Fe-S center protein